MHPALSVILFSTLSGAGYGLLAWAALAALAGVLPARPLLAATVLALVLVTVGLLSSLAHLGKPRRAWRAFSQWRSSWLSREGVAAVLTYVPALLFGALLLPGMLGAELNDATVALNARGVVACVALIACALATVVCTAMIYVSLKPIPAWRHRLVVPGYLLFALLTGGLLLAAIAQLAGAPIRGDATLHGLLLAVVAAALACMVLKARYWHDIDRAPLPVSRGDAVGLPHREIGVFERPHTDGNYLTREMAFVLARKHVQRLRVIALLLFGGLPLLAALVAWFLPPAAAFALPLAATGALLGTLVERWLFFAQARHLVTLYY